MKAMTREERHCSELLEQLEYHREGFFTWKKRLSNFIKGGERAGHVDNQGYERIAYKRKRISTHRVVYYSFYGYLPKFIDHIDGDKLNNKPCNLREASRSQNTCNTGANKKNQSGYKGVSKCGRKWRVCISLKGKNKHLGLFECKHEAAQVYNTAARMYQGEFAYTNEVIYDTVS